MTANQFVYFFFSPTDFDGVAEVQWFPGFLTLLEMAYVKMGQRVVDKAMHGAVWAVHVLVDHPRDEVGSEGDDKSLSVGKRRRKCPGERRKMGISWGLWEKVPIHGQDDATWHMVSVVVVVCPSFKNKSQTITTWQPI